MTELDRVRTERIGFQATEQGEVCLWDALFDEARALDARTDGPALEVYAERLLSRTTGAESTRMDDQRMWEESFYDPSISDLPLGVGERFGYRGVRTITRAEIRSWLAETQRRPGRGGTMSESQVRQRFYLLRRLLAEAVDDDEIEVNPAASIKPPTRPQGRAVTGLMRAEQDHRWLPSAEEMQRIIDAIEEPTAACGVALAFGAGMRAGEVIALERRNLIQHGPQRWSVRIVASETQRAGRRLRSPTKTGVGGQGERHLPEWVGEVVERYLEARKIEPTDRLLKSLGKVSAPSISYAHFVKHLTKATAALSMSRLTMQDLRAAGEAEVARRLGRPAAAAWARHSLQVEMGHYVAVERAKTSVQAAGWEESE